MEESIDRVRKLIKEEKLSLGSAVKQVAIIDNVLVVDLLAACQKAFNSSETQQGPKKHITPHSPLPALARGRSIATKRVSKCVAEFRAIESDQQWPWFDQAMAWVAADKARREERFAIPYHLQEELLIIIAAHMWHSDKQLWYYEFAPCRLSDGSTGWCSQPE
jgi:hypothetical protein